MKIINKTNITLILEFIVNSYVEYMSEPLIEYSNIHMNHLDLFLADFSNKEQLYLRKTALEILNFGGFNINCPKDRMFNLKIEKRNSWIKNKKQFSIQLIPFPNI